MQILTYVIDEFMLFTFGYENDVGVIRKLDTLTLQV